VPYHFFESFESVPSLCMSLTICEMRATRLDGSSCDFLSIATDSGS
jgi:hypothetical protein